MLGNFNRLILSTCALYSTVQMRPIVFAQERPIMGKKRLRHQSLGHTKQHEQMQQQHGDLTGMVSIQAERSMLQETYYTPPSDYQGAIDFFLLSGQSNMIGHTTSASSIEGNDYYWMQIKAILEAGGNPAVMHSALYDIVLATNSQHQLSDPIIVATTLTEEIMNLYTAGLLNNLDTPLSLGTCSFVRPYLSQISSAVEDVSGGTNPTVWNATCGSIFGHELTFSRTLELEMGQQNRFEAVKNAHGGTEIYEHWYPDRGLYWQTLRSSITSRKGYGNWKGFIWHQGTQEAWTSEDTSVTYMGNLTGLIEGVRAEMFDASEAGFWLCKEEIPVVIVQIGHWPQNLRSARVREAQANFCAGDPRAELVIMDDLSRFYHFDAPSFLIGGHRIAKAYQVAAQAGVTCPPTPTPSVSPANSITSMPSSQLSSQPSDQPSSQPSGQPSIQPPHTVWMDWDHMKCVQGEAEFWRTYYGSINECCHYNLPSILAECQSRSVGT